MNGDLSQCVLATKYYELFGFECVVHESMAIDVAEYKVLALEVSRRGTLTIHSPLPPIDTGSLVTFLNADHLVLFTVSNYPP